MSRYYDLSKEQKKIARRVIDKGLETQYARVLDETGNIYRRWSGGGFTNNREAYKELYSCIKEHDRDIALTYNGVGGSRWVELMSDQLAIGVISKSDLEDFDEEVRKTIIIWSQPDL